MTSPAPTGGADRDPRAWWLAGEDAADLAAQLAGRGPDDDPPPPGPGPARLGIVDPDDRRLRLARRLLSEGTPWGGRGDIWFDPVGVARTGDVAFLFPGVEPAFGAEAMEVPALARRLGLDAPPIEDDSVPHRAASIIRLGVFLDAAMARLGVRPGAIAGHSIGEWAGTVASGIVPPDEIGELLDVVELGDVDLPDLDFAAFGAGVDAVGPVVDALEDIVVSHDNSPSQAIVCGRPPVVDEAIARLRDRGVLGYRLGFQSGFHTPAMADGLDKFRVHLDRMHITAAAVPLWSSTIVAPYPATREEITELHLRHLVDPVRFRPVVERLYHDAGVRVFVQMGTGSLTAFVADTLDGLDHAAVPLLASKRTALAQMHRAVTALWVAGVDVHRDALVAEPPPTAARHDARPAPATPRTRVPDRVATARTSAPLDPAPAPAAQGVQLGPAAASLALVDAADLVSAAARAGQDVLTALAARLSPAPQGPFGEPSAPVPAFPAMPVAVPTVAPAPPAAPPPLAAPPRLAPPPTTAPAPPQPGTATPLAHPSPARGDEPPAGPWEPIPPQPWPGGPLTVVRRLSLATMPETLDHTLFEVPEDWPEVYDRFPIVAMTTQLQLIEDLAASYAGGRPVVEIFAVRNFRWLDISDPVDLEITVTPKGDDVLAVALGPYCRANVRVGSYPPAPRYEDPPLVRSRATVHTAAEMFEQRLMFHGPGFHGIPSMGPIGDDGMVGDFIHLTTPGSLLDNLGKLIAYWAIDKGGIGEAALPTGVAAVEHHGPLPAPGTPVRCDIRVVDLERDLIRADGLLIAPDGTVLTRVRGWTSILFHLDELMEPVHHRVGHADVAEVQPGGWVSVRERWPTGQARDLTGRRYLTRAEQAVYDGKNLLEQRRWLIDVIAAKDAFRHWLRDRFGLPCSPCQVTLVPDGDGRFRVRCALTPPGHDPRLTVWPLGWMAVVAVGDGAYRGIEAREVPEGTDPRETERAVARSLAARHPGADIASVPAPVNVVPCRLGIPDPPPYAVAWTSAGDPWTG